MTHFLVYVLINHCITVCGPCLCRGGDSRPLVESAQRVGCGGGGGGGGRESLHYINMSKDVPTKGVLFAESVWNGMCFIVKYLGRDSNITVWKGGGGKLP